MAPSPVKDFGRAIVIRDTLGAHGDQSGMATSLDRGRSENQCSAPRGGATVPFAGANEAARPR